MLPEERLILKYPDHRARPSPDYTLKETDYGKVKECFLLQKHYKSKETVSCDIDLSLGTLWPYP